MLVFALNLLLVLTLSTAQRSPYAGQGPNGRPTLANRFKDPNEVTPEVVNRVGDTQTTVRLPVDARGDENLVKRLENWPRDNQPFWLLNSEHIEASRGQQPIVSSGSNTGASSRSSNRNLVQTRLGPKETAAFIDNVYYEY